MPRLNLRLQTFISGGLLIALAIAIWWYSGTFPKLDDGYPGPALFPRIVSIGLGLCGLILLIQTRQTSHNSFSETVEPKDTNALSWLRLIGGLVCMIVFPLLYNLIGFIPALAISCLGIGILLKVKILQALIVALSSAVVIYLLFTKLLSVPL